MDAPSAKPPTSSEITAAMRRFVSRSEQTMFDCVAWLYDGFALPQPKGAAA